MGPHGCVGSDYLLPSSDWEVSCLQSLLRCLFHRSFDQQARSWKGRLLKKGEIVGSSGRSHFEPTYVVVILSYEL
jgi:hypothetical protein